MTITNKAFRKAMKEAGLGKVELCKNEDYFYIYSEDEETMNRILSLESTMILCHAFKDMSIESWVETISDMLEDGFHLDDLVADLWEANTKLPRGMKIEEKSSFYPTTHPGFCINLPGTGDISASEALTYAENIRKAVDLTNELDNKYKGKKVIYR